MEFVASELTAVQLYKLLTGAVVPRPIAWVSCRSAAGELNLAPFSFFNVVCASPPTLMVSVGCRDDGVPKDTAIFARETGELVVNITTEDVVEHMNVTSIDAPSGVSEFEIAGLTPAPSIVVAPPRVLESPVSFECRLAETLQIGQSTLLFAQVLYLHVRDDVYRPDHKIDAQALRPVGRLSGPSYGRVREIFDIRRPKWGE